MTKDEATRHVFRAIRTLVTMVRDDGAAEAWAHPLDSESAARVVDRALLEAPADTFDHTERGELLAYACRYGVADEPDERVVRSDVGTRLGEIHPFEGTNPLACDHCGKSIAHTGYHPKRPRASGDESR